MLLVVAAAIATSVPAVPPALPATARATASIQILTSVRLRVGSERSKDGRPLRLTTIRGEDGSQLPAKVAEFE